MYSAKDWSLDSIPTMEDSDMPEKGAFRTSLTSRTSVGLVTAATGRRVRNRKWGLQKWLDSPLVVAMMSLITVYVLFADDMRMLLTSVHEDDGFFAMVCMCMGMFALEILLSLYAKPDYRWSYYFYLDLIATVSLITDIGWIWEHVTNTQDTNQLDQVRDASKTSRTTSRSLKVIQIVRLVRLIRLVKLYKGVQTALKERRRAKVQPEAFLPTESLIGKRLSELTIKRVLFFVLLLLVMLPLFELDLYYSDPTGADFSLKQLNRFSGTDGFAASLEEVLLEQQSIRPLILLSYEHETGVALLTAGTSVQDLRTEEKYYAAEGRFVGIFDMRVDIQMAARLSICRTLFVFFVLALSSLAFTKDAQVLVIAPIEKMMRSVATIAKDPIHATERQQEEPSNTPARSCCRPVQSSHYETQLLEDTLLKISSLLGLGFGEAGARMIAQNLGKNQDLNLLLEGTKMMGIFGFCDIRNFTDTTEILREDVMLFVNQIAGIVHYTVATCLGFANKNIGDAFLLVWKFDSDDLVRSPSGLLQRPSSIKARNRCDLALVSFLKVLVEINTAPSIVSYRKHSGLLRRMPDFAVKMGFGLHLGWAIEGAIGSDLKVDASYLSPHVNLASRLEAATKQYGVPLLISGSLVSCLNSRTALYCRHIDTVIVKGSIEPERLYTTDLETQNMRVCAEQPYMKVLAVQKRKDLLTLIESPDFDATQLLDRTKGLSQLRLGFTQEFLESFEQGLQSYLQGRWPTARREMQRTLELKPGDGPSKALMAAMEEWNWEAPVDWPGYRTLSEK